MLDTSAWIELALGGQKAQQLAAAQGARAAIVHDLVLGELVSVGQRLAMPHLLQLALEGAKEEAVLRDDCLDGGRLHGALRAAGHPKVGLVDCIIYACSRRLGVDLLTFDGDLEGRPGAVYLGPASPRRPTARAARTQREP